MRHANHFQSQLTAPLTVLLQLAVKSMGNYARYIKIMQSVLGCEHNIDNSLNSTSKAGLCKTQFQPFQLP